MPVGRLEQVPLRAIWPNEARDFTTWLTENLDFLGEGSSRWHLRSRCPG